jgi:Trk-type K+ transport system membrane component
VSAISNAGFSPLQDSLMKFVGDWYMNIFISILILTGNNFFPATIRFIVWIGSNIKWKYSIIFKYLLNTHHHTTLHLFPGLQTRVYVMVTILLQLLAMIVGMSMEFNNPAFSSFTGAQKFLFVFFQGISTRTAGFNTVDLSTLSTATLLIYLFMMRVKSQMFCQLNEGAYNVASVESALTGKKKKAQDHDDEQNVPIYNPLLYIHSRVLYGQDEEGEENKHEILPLSTRIINYLLAALRKIYYHAHNILIQNNSWLIVMIFLICASEYKRMVDEPANFTFFRILFEVISAFGTVGLSLGYPGSVVSFSGQFSVFGKLCIIFVMILGRHRGLLGSMKDQESEDDHVLNTAPKEKKPQLTTSDNNQA